MQKYDYNAINNYHERIMNTLKQGIFRLNKTIALVLFMTFNIVIVSAMNCSAKESEGVSDTQVLKTELVEMLVRESSSHLEASESGTAELTKEKERLFNQAVNEGVLSPDQDGYVVLDQSKAQGELVDYAQSILSVIFITVLQLSRIQIPG